MNRLFCWTILFVITMAIQGCTNYRIYPNNCSPVDVDDKQIGGIIIDDLLGHQYESLGITFWIHDDTKKNMVLFVEYANVTIPSEYFKDCGAVKTSMPSELRETTHLPKGAPDEYATVYRCTKLPPYLKQALIMYSEYNKTVMIWGSIDDYKKMPNNTIQTGSR